MTVKFRSYNRELDYDRVNDFLVNMYQAHGGAYRNWLQPRWEYMHYHPGTNTDDLYKIGIWEDNNKIVAIANYEHPLGQLFVQINPNYNYLKPDLVEYAEKNLSTVDKDGKRYLKVYPTSFDKEFIELLEKKGYKPVELDKKWCEITQFDLSKEVPEVSLPAGFRLQSLADEYDIHKVDRALWRGFNHEGEPNPDEIGDRELMHSAPNFDRSLNIVVVAPNGNYVSYSGIWYDSINKISYVEPVATDPDYRKMGLGKAAVLECVRRTKALGAKYAVVESGQEFYHAIGFKHLFYRCPWVKYFG